MKIILFDLSFNANIMQYDYYFNIMEEKKYTKRWFLYHNCQSPIFAIYPENKVIIRTINKDQKQVTEIKAFQNISNINETQF